MYSQKLWRIILECTTPTTQALYFTYNCLQLSDNTEFLQAAPSLFKKLNLHLSKTWTFNLIFDKTYEYHQQIPIKNNQIFFCTCCSNRNWVLSTESVLIVSSEFPFLRLSCHQECSGWCNCKAHAWSILLSILQLIKPVVKAQQDLHCEIYSPSKLNDFPSSTSLSTSVLPYELTIWSVKSRRAEAAGAAAAAAASTLSSFIITPSASPTPFSLRPSTSNNLTLHETRLIHWMISIIIIIIPYQQQYYQQ